MKRAIDLSKHSGATPASPDVESIHAEMAALGGTDPFAAAVQATRMPMLITNPRLEDNPIVFVNDAFCRLTGYARGEIVGRNCRFLQGPATDPATFVEMRTAVCAGMSVEVEIQNHRKDGSTFWNRLLMAPVHDARGRLIYFFASQLDITHERERFKFLQDQNEILEQRVAARTRELVATNSKLLAEAAERQRVEGALRQAQKMEAIGHLTGGIAHDLNNMLQGVASGIELAKRRMTAGEMHRVPDLLDAAMQAGHRATELTRRLLAFGRKQALNPKTIVVDELARGMASLIQQTVGPAIAVELRLQEHCWPIQCDPNQLENAILNLAINARDAMLPAGGNLLIETAHATLTGDDADSSGDAELGDYVRITVSDTGTGMTPDVKAHAFEPFFTTKPDGQGTGLGLSQIDGFVHQSDGIARLESRLGVGTSAHLYLPRFRDQVASSAPLIERPPDRAIETTGGTVLLVEDEPTIREFAAIALREIGCHVLEAGSADEGLLRLQAMSPRSPIDLLVTDLGLPGGLNGRQLAEAAREFLPDLPVLFITGYAGTPDRGGQAGLAHGMEFLNKPFELSVLCKRVKRMIECPVLPEPAAPGLHVAAVHMPR